MLRVGDILNYIHERTDVDIPVARGSISILGSFKRCLCPKWAFGD